MAQAAVRRLDRYDWLIHGIETLREEGVELVRVEPMARSLGVTKGSFYWHFKDRGELLDRLLEYWETEMTDRIDVRVAHLHGSAEKQLLGLVEYITKEGINRYDAAVRAWALYDERAARVVRRVDAKRLDSVYDLFARMGHSPEQADLRSRIFYYCLVGEFAAFVEQRTLEERLEQARQRTELLTEC